jgi:hypothetical protein
MCVALRRRVPHLTGPLAPARAQEPLLDLMYRHLDDKKKQAKLKSPQELQELLDVTSELLASMEQRKPGERAPGATDHDDFREKLRIVKVLVLGRGWRALLAGGLR